MPVNHPPHGLDMIIPIFGTILVLLIPVAIVLIVLRHRREMAALRHRTLLDLAARGTPIPPELLVEAQQKDGAGDLRRGLVLSFTGIGAVIFAFTLPDHEAWGIGLLPLFVGLGYLATWLSTRTEKLPDSDA